MVQAKQSSSIASEVSYSTSSALAAVQSSSLTTSYTIAPAKQQQESSVSTAAAAATTPLRDESVGDNPKILINPLANTTTATAEDDKKKSSVTSVGSTVISTASVTKANAPLYPTGASNSTSGYAAASSGSAQSNNTLGAEYEGAASSIMASSVIAFALAIAAFAL